MYELGCIFKKLIPSLSHYWKPLIKCSSEKYLFLAMLSVNVSGCLHSQKHDDQGKRSITHFKG